MIEEGKVNAHAAYPKLASGQLLFLGSWATLPFECVHLACLELALRQGAA